MNTFFKACAYLSVLTFSGNILAATDKDAPIPMNFKPPGSTQTQNESNSNIVSNECSFSMSDFQDDRQNKETIGHRFVAPLKVTNVDGWLSKAKEALFDGPLSKASNGNKAIVMQPSLTRLYSYAENMNIHGVIALRVEITRDGELLETRRYRGLGSKVNWAGGVGEYHTAAQLAIENVSAIIIEDLGSICSIDK